MAHLFSRLTPDSSVVQQTQRIFDIYNIFRLVLSLVLLISFTFAGRESLLGSLDPVLYQRTAVFYLTVNILIFLRGFVWRSRPLNTNHYVGIIILDVLVLVMISYTCGGVASGMASLLIIPVAAGAVLIPGILSIFLAAVGSIAVIYGEVYLYFSFDGSGAYYVQAGLLGVILFATALVIQLLSRRLRQNEILAAQQSARIQYLVDLNEQVIQRMNTGLVVVDTSESILITNDAARKLLKISSRNQFPLILPEVLQAQLREWKVNPYANTGPFRLDPESTQIQASFSWLNPEEKTLVLVFLEDFTVLTSRVQHLKLMSLGRLTASIAHEVRNPLGAISHASQLLRESDTIHVNDLRLTDIIQKHSQRINTIIDNILDLSRTRNSTPELLDLAKWLPHFLQIFRNSCGEDTEIELHCDASSLNVRCNESQLQRLLTNLCENGLRYSYQATGRYGLTVKAGVDPTTEAPFINVIDEGKGITPANQEQIFEPFFTTEKEGTGLGLYICREICEANQAQINYRRNENNKSCFRINFVDPDKFSV